MDALVLSDLGPLKMLLGASSVTKVIHNARFERRVLGNLGIEIEPVFDTLEASRKKHGVDALGGHDLAMVVQRELGVALDKGEQTSNWTLRPLSLPQRAYGATDAEVLIHVSKSLSNGETAHDVYPTPDEEPLRSRELKETPVG